MMNDDRFRLDQAPATEAEWRDAVDGVLKGRPFKGGAGEPDRRWPRHSAAVRPGLHRTNSARRSSSRRLRVGYPAAARGDLASVCQAAVLDDLEHGVTSIELGTPATAWGLDELRDAEGVLLDIAPVVLAPRTDLGPARPRGSSRRTRCPHEPLAGLDPIGAYARNPRRCDHQVAGAV